MTRERSTWNINHIAKQAGLKVADPYTMNNPEHAQQQPAADAYVIGDPSDFAEDVHPSAGTWESEYSGGQVKRNEIGMPEMRGDTFNHPEKTASKEVLTKKAALCVAIARAILPKTASNVDVEEQSISFMHLPDSEVMSTYTRLASQQEDQGQQDEGQKQAQDQQAQAQQDQEKQAGKIPPQFLENVKKKQEEAKDGDKDQGKQAQDQQEQDQGKQDQGKQAQDQQDQQQVQAAQQDQQAQGQDVQAAMQQQLAQLIQQAQQQLQQLAGQQQQAPQVQVAQMQQQSAAQQVAQAVQQAVAQGQDPVEACAKAMAQGQQIQQQGNDGELIDQMLAQQTQQQSPMANMDIELDTPTMDVGEVQLGPEDDMLRSLFANDETQQAEQAQDGGQQKQAHAVRTASTRTVGTIPTQGVSRIGGGSTASSTGSGDKLASIWSSAPDVREAFGIPTNR
jgi:hypothetical protein